MQGTLKSPRPPKSRNRRGLANFGVFCRCLRDTVCISGPNQMLWARRLVGNSHRYCTEELKREGNQPSISMAIQQAQAKPMPRCYHFSASLASVDIERSLSIKIRSFPWRRRLWSSFALHGAQGRLRSTGTRLTRKTVEMLRECPVNTEYVLRIENVKDAFYLATHTEGQV